LTPTLLRARILTALVVRLEVAKVALTKRVAAMTVAVGDRQEVVAALETPRAALVDEVALEAVAVETLRAALVDEVASEDLSWAAAHLIAWEALVKT